MMTNPTTHPLPSGDDLAVRLGELLAKATPGPWIARQDGLRELSNITAFIEAEGGSLVSYGHLKFEDRDFIVAMHEALPQLLADLAALNARVEEARGVIEPFAKAAVNYDPDPDAGDNPDDYADDCIAEEEFAIGHFRAARAWLTKETSDGEG